MIHTTSACLRTFCRDAMAAIFIMAVLCGCAMRKPLAPEFFAMEETRLSALIDKTEDASVLAGWYVDRARLRVRADNPHPDYSGALKDFTVSLNLNPGQRDVGDVRDWIAVLSHLADIEQRSILLESQYQAVLEKLSDIEEVSTRLKSQYKRAQRQNLALKNYIARLEKLEKELRKSIEELQSLELHMEQRRQQLR